jgi:ketosteroid isomerase-like protein
MYAAVEAADLDAMAALWIAGPLGESAVCVHPGWAPIRGRSRVLRAWALIMANTSYIQFFLTDVDITVSGDVGTVTCVENILTGVGADAAGGDGLPGGQVAATNILRRTPDGWQVWVHHASPVMTLPADEQGESFDRSDDVPDVAEPGEDDR